MARSRFMGASVPIRREPPKFRRVEVVRTADVTPRLLRVTLAGEELDGFTVEEPAASVRLLLPVGGELVMPTWEGNEFLLPDGSRPVIRTLTPRYVRDRELDVDIVLDCRFLPNPHWVEELRPLTGLDEPVKRYVLDQPESKDFLKGLEPMLDRLLPAYVKEGKSYLTIAFGCTGGHHRSVAIAEEVAAHLKKRGFAPSVSHRDIER